MGADTGVTTRSLASTATLDSLKKQARSFLKAVQSGDASARSRVAPYFVDIANAGLQDIQLVLAREFDRRGADVDAFFLDSGQYRFPVLTGVFGEGEAGKIRQPQHPDDDAIVSLLRQPGTA